MKRWGAWAVGIAILGYSCRWVNPMMIKLESDRPSVSTGVSWKGDLEHGKRLPNSGNNFQCVSYLLTALGRNGVHQELRSLTTDVYDSLYKLNPKWRFLYGETGWVRGGKFWPHYTHQNGLVIDFMVPVLNCQDSSVALLPNHVFKRFGYECEFDSLARYKDYCIDFEAMATHLYLLQEMGKSRGLTLSRIIFEPDYLPQLYATLHGKSLKSIRFVYNKAWVRHDDHYHTEFSLVNP